MNSCMIFQLIKKEIKMFNKNKLIFMLGIYVIIESFRSIVQYLGRNIQNNTVFDIHQEALVRGSVFPLVIFLLLSGYILFSYFRRDRLQKNADIFFPKPIKTLKILLSRFIAVTIMFELIYLIGFLISSFSVTIIFDFGINIFFLLKVFFFLPFFTILIWNILILFLTMLTTDFRVGLPIIFLIWFVSQLSSKSFIIGYNKIMNSSIISDQYILINRFYWLAISIFLFVLSTKIYDKYRNGKRIHLIFFKNKDKKTSNIKNIRLKNKLFSEMIYSIKIYSGWRILIGLLVSIILALIYSRLVQRQYRVFLYLGTGEIFLSLLGILGTLGINNIEKEKRTIKYIGSLPFNEKRLLRQKLFVSFIYFLAVYLSYTLFGMIFIGTFITKMTLIFIPSYLFFSVLVLILSKMFKSTLLGGIFIGFIWFLPIVAGRKFPYWIHPFYYFAEFDHYYNNFLLKNKIILLVITMILIISFLLVKKVKISKE